MTGTPRHPGASTVEELPERFLRPHPDSRPTPFFWWSGADLERDRLRAALDLLAEKSIGGTIVGYSQHPDNELDAGDPMPFTPKWWELVRWYCDESERRGLVVGVQDYGIIGSVLLDIGDETASQHGGSLHHVAETVTGPCLHEMVVNDTPPSYWRPAGPLAIRRSRWPPNERGTGSDGSCLRATGCSVPSLSNRA